MEKRKRIKMLDYIKAVAIVFVIINHSFESTGCNALAFKYIIRMAVPLYMLVSGFTFAMSSRKYENIWEYYRPYNFISKLVRFTIPMLIVYILYIILRFIEGGVDPKELFMRLVYADFTKGGYYYYCIIQLLIIYPFIYMTVKKRGGVWWVCAINVLYELVLYFFPLYGKIYRILVLRYLALVGWGTWLYLNREKRISTVKLVISFIIGVIYIYLHKLYGLNGNIFRYPAWSNTSFMVVFYIFPMFYWLVMSGKEFSEKTDRVFSEIGKSTYHIMCTQMIWFWFAPYIYSVTAIPLWVQFALNTVINCAIGYMFYLFDMKYIQSKIKY